MFKFLALGALLSLNISCLCSDAGAGSGPSKTALVRTPSGRFFDTAGAQITAVTYYQEQARLGILEAPSQEGFIYRIGTQRVSKAESEIATLVLAAKAAGDELAKTPGSAEHIALLHVIANKLESQDQRERVLFPKPSLLARISKAFGRK